MWERDRQIKLDSKKERDRNTELESKRKRKGDRVK